MLKGNGETKAAYGYDAYGKAEGPTTSCGAGCSVDLVQPFRFGGHRFDTGSDTIDMGARRFGPDTQSFLGRDFYRGALADLSLSLDPLTNNRYGLAGGNPVSFVELDGHAVIGDGGGAAAKDPKPDKSGGGGGSTGTGGGSGAGGGGGGTTSFEDRWDAERRNQKANWPGFGVGTGWSPLGLECTAFGCVTFEGRAKLYFPHKEEDATVVLDPEKGSIAIAGENSRIELHSLLKLTVVAEAWIKTSIEARLLGQVSETMARCGPSSLKREPRWTPTSRSATNSS